MLQLPFLKRPLTLFDLLLFLVLLLFFFCNGILIDWIHDPKRVEFHRMLEADWALVGSGSFITIYEFNRWKTWRKTRTPLSNFSVGLGFVAAGCTVPGIWLLINWYLEVDFNFLPIIGLLLWVVGIYFFFRWVIRWR